jgi:hypothetical protein
LSLSSINLKMAALCLMFSAAGSIAAFSLSSHLSNDALPARWKNTIITDSYREEAYDRREEYKVTTKRLFKGRLDRLRADIRKKQAFAASDSAALANDRLLHPVPTHNHRGEPRWEGSEAQRLLRQDIDLGNHLDLMPRDLFMSEPDYYDNYPLEVFRKHIKQEVKLRKFLHQYG